MSHPALKGLQPSLIQPGQRFFALVNLASAVVRLCLARHVQGVIYATAHTMGKRAPYGTCKQGEQAS